MNQETRRLTCLCLMLALALPLGLRAQDQPVAKSKNARRATAAEARQDRIARQYEKLAREMEEMGERLESELAPELELLRDTLPDMLAELEPALAEMEIPHLEAELAGLRHLPFELPVALPELAGLAEIPPIPEVSMIPPIPPMPALAPHAPFLAHGMYRSEISSRYRQYLSADESVQAEALRSLVHQDEKLALPELQRMASHQNWAMRAAVVEMLGGIDSKEAVVILREVLQRDNDQRVRRAAVRSLSHRSEPEARAALQGLWQK